jgi:RND family efflux transporter MFP subunit
MRLRPRLAVVFLIGLPLLGCDGTSSSAQRPAFKVVAQKVAVQSFQSDLTLTGAVRARVQTELSFRVSGRVVERMGEVGQHVAADAILARLDPTEQQADLDAAKAGLAGAEATMRQTAAAFERQKSLLASGFTTHAAYEAADRSQRTAAGSLDAARAQVAAAQDALSYTELRAGHAGVITARNIEVGQVAQAAQQAFGFAEDGPRDAVFAVYESMASHRPAKAEIDLTLVSDPKVTAPGKIREISPVVDEKSGTVQIKVEIVGDRASAMPLGAAVTGHELWRLEDVFVLPWTAMTEKDGKPALWIVDSASGAVSLRPVDVALYAREQIILRDGVKAGELVVTEGGKFLREGQIVDAQTGGQS